MKVLLPLAAVRPGFEEQGLWLVLAPLAASSGEPSQMDWFWLALALRVVVLALAGLKDYELITPLKAKESTVMARPGWSACETSSNAGSFPLCALYQTLIWYRWFRKKQRTSRDRMSDQVKNFVTLVERTNKEYKPTQSPSIRNPAKITPCLQ